MVCARFAILLIALLIPSLTRAQDVNQELLEAAYEERDARLYMIRFDPVVDRLRDDPRFQSLLRRMNFPEN